MSQNRKSVPLWAWLLLAAFLFSVFSGLGTWQVYRLSYKQDLMDRVDAKAHGKPVDVPGVADWASITREGFEYLRVQATGMLDASKGRRTLAVTELGNGSWYMVPLATDAGFSVWVNTGFVKGIPSHIDLPKGTITVTGLLRLTEPKGGFLRDNKPAEGRWYSRDLQALSQDVGIANVAPYFIDAFTVLDVSTGEPADPYEPIKGLTVLKFPNNHLQYALTWFAMALITAGLTFWLWKGRGKTL